MLQISLYNMFQISLYKIFQVPHIMYNDKNLAIVFLPWKQTL